MNRFVPDFERESMRCANSDDERSQQYVEAEDYDAVAQQLAAATAKVEAQGRTIQAMGEEIADLKMQVMGAERAREEAMKDAERYRWLRDQNANVESVDAWTITRCDFTGAEGPDRYWVGIDLDTAIDAARLAPEDTTTAGEGNG